MNICLINGSIRRRGVSGRLCKELKLLLGKEEITLLHWPSSEAVRESEATIRKADALVLLFGIYFDALPSHLIEALEEAQKLLESHPSKPSVYAVINCGYYEPHNNALAEEVLSHWCARSGLSFCGSVSIGGGGGYLSLGRTPMGEGEKKELGQALLALAHLITSAGDVDRFTAQLCGPREVYFAQGNAGWEQAAARAGLSPGDLRGAPEYVGEEK